MALRIVRIGKVDASSSVWGIRQVLYHGSEVIQIDGERYRIKEARETAEKKALVGGFQTPSAREHNAVAVAKTA